MSRSGYHDDCDDQWAAICYRGAVASALRGKRGQALLREALEAFDAMPVKELAADSLTTADGAFCTLGAVGAKRGIDMAKLDPEDPYAVAAAFDIAESMAREVVFMNDEARRHVWQEWPGPARDCYEHLGRMRPETPAERWARMRAWLVSKIEARGASDENR